MMKKSLMILLLLVVFISGCGEDEIDTVGPFVGGSDGLAISFVNGAPLTEFSQGIAVPVTILLKNNGEYDLNEGLAQVQLYGLPMDEYGLSSDYLTVNGKVRGIKKDLLEEGGEQSVGMGTLMYSRDVSGFTDKTLYSRVCYPYQTKGVITACITSKNIELAEEGSICDVVGDKLVSGSVSSGPIQLTAFEEQLTGSSSVSFRMTIENSAAGNVYAYDTVCSSLSDPVTIAAKKGRVRVTVKPEDIICNFLEGESNVGLLNVIDGSKTLVCTMEVDGSSSYERDVEVELDYKYTEDTSIGIRILEA